MKSLYLLVLLMVFICSKQIPVAMCQDLIDPIKKDRLVRSLEANKVERRSSEKMTVAKYIK